MTQPAKTASAAINAKAADNLSTVRINSAKKAALTVISGQCTIVTVTLTTQSRDSWIYTLTVS